MPSGSHNRPYCMPVITQWIPVTGEYQRLLSGAETDTVYIALKDVWLLSGSLPGTCFSKLVGRVSYFSFFLSGSHLYPNNLVLWGRDCRDEILTYAVSVKKKHGGKGLNWNVHLLYFGCLKGKVVFFFFIFYKRTLWNTHNNLCSTEGSTFVCPFPKQKVSPNWTWLLFQQAEGLIWKTKATHPLSVISLNKYYVIYSTEQLITLIFWVQILTLQTSLTFLSNGAILHLCTGKRAV